MASPTMVSSSESPIPISLWVVYVGANIGFGVFTKAVIRKDCLVMVYYGEVISAGETDGRHARRIQQVVSIYRHFHFLFSHATSITNRCYYHYYLRKFYLL